MGIVDPQAIEMDKIKSKMKLIFELLKNNGSKMNKAIEFKVQGIYYDFLITQVPDKKLLGDFYFAVGLGYQLLSGEENKIKTLEFLHQAEGMVDKRDIDKLYEIYNEIGIAYYELKNNDMAYRFYNLAYQLGTDNKLDVNKISASLVNLSTVNTRKREYKSAIIYLKKALEVFEYNSIQNYKDETLQFLGNIYRNLAINYIQLFQYEEAIEYYQLGLKFIKNKEHFRLREIKFIQYIMKDIEDENEMRLINDFLIKFKHL